MRLQLSLSISMGLTVGLLGAKKSLKIGLNGLKNANGQKGLEEEERG